MSLGNATYKQSCSAFVNLYKQSCYGIPPYLLDDLKVLMGVIHCDQASKVAKDGDSKIKGVIGSWTL